jgi:hypothetical protein
MSTLKIDADATDFVPLHELPLWTSAATVAGTVGLMFGGPVGAILIDDIGFRA